MYQNKLFRPLCGLLFLFGFLGLSNCVVPAQLTRVTLTESFSQNFDFGGIPREEISPILHSLLGKEWSPYSSEEVIERWESKSIIAKGIAVLTFSLVPGKKAKEFFISGVGAYDIYDLEDSKMFFSSKFYILDDRYYSFEDLQKKDYLSVYFEQVMVNQFLGERKALEPILPIRVDVKIKKNKNKPIFGVAYEEEHQVYIGEAKIGTIKFRAPKTSFDKMIDLRGIKTLPRRYKTNHRFE